MPSADVTWHLRRIEGLDRETLGALRDVSSSTAAGTREVAKLLRGVSSGADRTTGAVRELGADVAGLAALVSDGFSALGAQFDHVITTLERLEELLANPSAAAGAEQRRWGKSNLEQGLLEEAEQDFTAALEANRYDVAAHVGLGLTLVQSKQWAGAAESFRLAARYSGSRSDLRAACVLAQADALDEGEQSEAAIAALEESLAGNLAGYPTVWLALARRTHTVEPLVRALELDPWLVRHAITFEFPARDEAAQQVLLHHERRLERIEAAERRLSEASARARDSRSAKPSRSIGTERPPLEAPGDGEPPAPLARSAAERLHATLLASVAAERRLDLLAGDLQRLAPTEFGAPSGPRPDVPSGPESVPSRLWGGIRGVFSGALLLAAFIGWVGFVIGSLIGDDPHAETSAGVTGAVIGAGLILVWAFLSGYREASQEARAHTARRKALDEQRTYEKLHAAAFERRSGLVAEIQRVMQEIDSIRLTPPPAVAVLG